MNGGHSSSKAKLTWFACCDGRRGNRVAWVLDAYPEERAGHTRDLRRHGMLVGEFPTEKEAFAAACAASEEQRRRPRRR
jgi:hypothetical protein